MRNSMTIFDCKSMHPKCKAGCCGIVPIPEETYNNNQHKIVTQPHEVLKDDNHHVIPLTANATCVFLNRDYSCNIYEDRPSVCREFGNESHIMLCCPYIDKEGKTRCRQAKRRIEREASNYISKLRLI
jgi:hypothetical protein